MNKVVESRPQGNHSVVWRVALLLLILGMVLTALLLLLMLIDVLRGHPGATWHMVTSGFDALKPWLIALGVIALTAEVVLPHLEARHQTALQRAEAAVKRAEAKRIKHETCILRELHDHNMENLPPVFFHKPDVNGNYAQPIGPDGRPVAFLLPGNSTTGNGGIPAKMVLDYLQQQNAVEGEYYEEEDAPAQIEGPKKILLSQQIAQGLTSPDEEESVFGYPIDTREPFMTPLFQVEGNFVNSLFVVGEQGSGKSAIGTYLAALTVNHRGYILGIDPDAEREQSLSNRLGPLKDFLLCEIADTPEKAERVLDMAENEIDHPGDYPAIFLVDEFSMIMRAKKLGGKWKKVADRVASQVENWATRGRKRLRRVVVFGQISNASRTGGTELRDVCDYLVFNTSVKKAERVLDDASDEEIAELAPSLAPGTAIVLPAGSSETYIMQFTFPDDRGLNIIAEVRNETDEIVEHAERNPLPHPRLQVLHWNGADAASGHDVRPASEPMDDSFDARMYSPQNYQEGAWNKTIESDPYAYENDVRQPLDEAHETHHERTADYPLLDAIQVELFATAYEITGNMDESLKRARANTRYRDHARQIIRERKLRRA